MRAARASLISAALLAAHAAPAIARFPAGRRFFPTTTRIRGTSSRSVALTFDDGPDDCLESFLDVLDEAGARATFFIVGEQVERDPGRLREIIARGHEVAVHCYRHRSHLRLTPGRTVSDMHRAGALIEDVSERSPRFFRPPYGVFNAASWAEANRRGWERVLWARWGKDWEAQATPRSVVETLGPPEPGDILLLHDSDRYAAPGSWRSTLVALPMILGDLSSRGIGVCSVGELLDKEK